jgi:hypothetical protein
MNNFLGELRSDIFNSRVTSKDENGDIIDNAYKIAPILNKIDSLGENARRMFEIGIVQDELVKSGFRKDSCNITTDDGAEIGIDCFVSNQRLNVYDDGINEDVSGLIYLVFTFDVCEMYYKLSEKDCNLHWLDNNKHENVLTKIKELINHEYSLPHR